MPSPTDGSDPGGVAEIRRALAEGTVVAFTGAGVSAESGVPTFRGPGGLWRSHRPEDLATPGAFARDPELVWSWYRWRRSLVARCRPNAAHLTLARRAAKGGTLSVVTQNVDGLHAAAARLVAHEGHGAAPPPVELHGSLFRDRCTACAFKEDRIPCPPEEGAEPDGNAPDDRQSAPACPSCGQLLRPDVVWFGEALDASSLDAAFEAAAAADVCLVIGTSGMVFPAAQIPIITHRSGGIVIEVNPDATALGSIARYRIAGAAARVVPEILGPPREHAAS